MSPRKKTEKADADPMSLILLEDDEEVVATAEHDDAFWVVTSAGRKWRVADGVAEITTGPSLPVDDEDAEDDAAAEDDGAPEPAAPDADDSTEGADAPMDTSGDDAAAPDAEPASDE
jgi:hypothetical protein